MQMILCRVLLVLFVLLTLSEKSNSQETEWRINIGWRALQSELGTSLAEGEGVHVSQVEAPVAGGAYLPDFDDSEYMDPDKNFIDASGVNSSVSSHANAVGFVYYGNVRSASPGIIDITCYEANQWLNIVTGLSANANPQPQPFGAQNHSWIANQGISNSLAQLVLMRTDYMASENNMVMVAGTLNNPALEIPHLMNHGFNLLSVGKTNGSHSHGPTRFYIEGRAKPEIVCPSSSLTNQNAGTSGRAPMVAGAAAVLRSAGLGTNADNSEVVRAMILAGATKTEFANWENTPTIPIDTTFGVGELNTYNSYKILLGGETDGQVTPPSTPSGPLGWDFGSIEPGQILNYSFELTEPVDHFSIALTWDITIEDTNPSEDFFVPAFDLANLDLIAVGPNGFVKQSNSLNHNIEHIYARNLAPGIYSLVITPDAQDTIDFGVAWRAATETKTPVNKVQVVSGSIAGGSSKNLGVSDDIYYELRPNPVKRPINDAVVVVFESTLPVNMPNSISFEIESNVNTPNIEQTIEVFNFALGEYETFDTSPAALADSEVDGYVIGELFQFADESSGTIRARVTWDPVGPVLQFPWQVNVDRAEWTVSQ